MREEMVAAIAVASAGLGMLAGVAMASMPSSSSSSATSTPRGLPWRHASPSSPRCAACGGSGKEECRLCARWSDGGGASGCGACAGTRRAPCRSCGGGGKGRRAPVRVAARSSPALRPVAR